MLQRWDIDLPPGVRVAAHYAAPSTPAPAKAVIVAPGLGVHALYYGPFLQALARLGWHAIAIDPPHQGESPTGDRRAPYGYTYLAEHVVPAVLRQATGEFAPERIVLAGHSVGGHWMLSHLAMYRPDLTDDRFVGMMLIGSGALDAPTLVGRRPSLRSFAHAQWTRTATRSLGTLPGAGVGMGGRHPAELLRDTRRVARTGRLAARGSGVNVDNVLRRVQLPVLGLNITGDRLASESAVDNLLAKLPGATVTRERIAGPPGHTRWARDPDHVVTAFATWSAELLDTGAVSTPDMTYRIPAQPLKARARKPRVLAPSGSSAAHR